MNLIRYIKNNGLLHVFDVIYKYKIDLIVLKIIGRILKNIPLKDIIVIESHNDFDCNGGAFYQYLIDNGYNKKYKLVWLIKNLKDIPAELPFNVECVNEFKPDLKKDYYRWVAKFFVSDMNCGKKYRDNQVTLYQGHGSFGLKNCAGVCELPKDLDYCLTASEYTVKFDASQYSLENHKDRFRVCGFPSHDVFYSDKPGDLYKITTQNYNKIILWMPTFRKNIGGRFDGTEELSLGIPLVKTQEQYYNLNNFLEYKNILLIIKLHPKQDLTGIVKINTSNINVLSGEDVKAKGIDNYRLMKDCDALISDYSSVAYDFLHTKRPVAYDFSDLNSYTRGIIVEDPTDLIAGPVIREFSDLKIFINDIANDVDPFKEQRLELFDRLFKYHDGNSSERVVRLLNLK